MNAISRWIETDFTRDDGWLCVLKDTPSGTFGDRPRAIEGFVPDVFAGTSPVTFTLLGEAKTQADLDTKHTRSQLEAFLRFLQWEQEPHFVMAVPILLVPTARRLVQAAASAVRADRPQLYFLTCPEQSGES